MTDPLDRDANTGESNSTAPRDTDPKKSRPPITANRIILWVIVGGIGLYTLATGIVGMLTKSR